MYVSVRLKYPIKPAADHKHRGGVWPRRPRAAFAKSCGFVIKCPNPLLNPNQRHAQAGQKRDKNSLGYRN